MGYCPDPTPEMGEYSVEVRSESFYLRGEQPKEQDSRHGIYLYLSHFYNGERARQGTCEILKEDIPKIRAALDQVERIMNGNPNQE